MEDEIGSDADRLGKKQTKKMRSNGMTYRAAVVRSALTMAGSSMVFLSCCKNDGLWKATQAGSVLLMTISHSSMSSGVSL